jgi:two-component system NarL family sensor kinase
MINKHNLFYINLFICIIAARGSFAQFKNTTDSLENIVKQTLAQNNEDTSVVNKVNALSEELYKHRQYDKAMYYLHEAEKLSGKLEYKKGMAYSLYIIGGIEDAKHNFYNAEDSLLKALKISEDIGDLKRAVKELNFLGIVNQDEGDFSQALEYCLKGLKLAEQNEDSDAIFHSCMTIGNIDRDLKNFQGGRESYYRGLKIEENLKNKKGISDILTNIGISYYYEANYPKALEYYERSLPVKKEIKDIVGINQLLNDIGAVYLETKEYSKAMYYYMDQLDVTQGIGDANSIMIVMINIGDVYEDLNDHANALKYFMKADSVSDKANDKRGVAESCYEIGNVFGHLKQFSKALEYFNQGIANAKEINSRETVANGYLNISELYKDMSDYKLAYTYRIMYSALEDTLRGEMTTAKAADMQQKYETERKQNQIAALQNENELKQLAINKSRWQILGLIGGIAFLIISGLFLFQRIRLRSNQKLNAEALRQQELRLKAIVAAQEAERTRIANDLHDGVGQLLTGTKLHLRNLSDSLSKTNPELLEKFNISSKALDEASDEVRSISHQMMPVSLGQSGLISAIEAMLHKTLGHSNIKYVFEHSAVADRFSSDLEINLYRVTQELVNNCLKHSGANEISVQLFKNNNQLVLMVEDNGKGFNFDGHKLNGFGLMNIISRINSINGKINYETGHNGGTVATIRIPLT